MLNKQLLDLRAHGIPQSVKVPVSIEPETVTTKQTSVEKVTKQDESNEESASSSDSSQDSHSTVRSTYSRRRANDPHPPGFRSLSGRIEKFSGRQGDADFELWVMDFNEATTNCGWDDIQRAKWFSWFLSGPAKATWQRTLTAEDKSLWTRIVQIYRGQYGIHMDPRIAYQRCQELQYSQFGSAQGLLNAMRDYQRMAP